MHLYTHKSFMERSSILHHLWERKKKRRRREQGTFEGKMASGGGYQGNHVFPRAAAAPSAEMTVVPRPNQSGPSNSTLAAAAAAVAAAGQTAVREQDRFMPIANVIRIMRKVLPTHAKISDDAKETIQECVSEYISFITSEANDRCQREQRKTVTAEDVLWAMNKLGFDSYVEPLTLYLHRYRELEGDHRGSIRGEPLQLIKHRNVSMQSLSDMMNASAPMMFPASVQVAPQPNFVAPPSGTGTHSAQHFSLLGDQGMSSYLLGMYNGGGGGGEGPSNGNSSQAPVFPSFDHPYASYK